MTQAVLQGIAETVVRQAQRQRFVVAREIRDVLTEAGMSDTKWKEVVTLARPSLDYRRGRYYYKPAVSDLVLQEQNHQRAIHRAVRQLIRQHKAAARQIERRQQDRIDFLQQVKVQTGDQREFNLLSRDLSPTGIRLIGTRSLLGQKVRVLIPRTDKSEPWCFLVHILWTCTVGDGLFENGGMFVDVIAEKPVEDRG
jgi:hypothetical protein